MLKIKIKFFWLFVDFCVFLKLLHWEKFVEMDKPEDSNYINSGYFNYNFGKFNQKILICPVFTRIQINPTRHFCQYTVSWKYTIYFLKRYIFVHIISNINNIKPHF